jgi:L-arabinose isomerase
MLHQIMDYTITSVGPTVYGFPSTAQKSLDQHTGPEDTFSLIVAPIEVVAEDDSVDPTMRDVVRIWIRPRGSVAEFLEAYSRAGGTHHSALVLGERAEGIAAFGRMLGLEVVCLG